MRAHIDAIDSFSGHADHSELLDYFDRTTGPKTRVWLVHGEPEPAETLRRALAARHDGTVEVARLGDELEF